MVFGVKHYIRVQNFSSQYGVDGYQKTQNLKARQTFLLNLLLELALKDCFWGQTNKTENLKLIFFTSAKIFAFTCFPLF
jgi:hypothetical protein